MNMILKTMSSIYGPIKLPFQGALFLFVVTQGAALGYNELGFQPGFGLEFLDESETICINNPI